LTDLDIDYLAKDPRDIQLRWLDLNAPTQQLLLGMAEIVQEIDENERCISLKPIDIARRLVAAYDQLEFWTKRTMRLSPEAVRIRDILRHASDPNRLLFDELPALIGTRADVIGSETIAIVRTGLRELRARYHQMLDDLRKLLFKELIVINATPVS